MICDTGGQERYKCINETYYKRTDAILLVYDISKIKSFEEIKNYYVSKIRESCSKNIPILLLGNKTDLEEIRQVTQEQGIELAKKENYEFQESSCATNLNVAGTFEALVERWNFENHKNEKLKENKTERKIRAFSEFNIEIDNENYNSDINRKITFSRKKMQNNINRTRTFTLKIENKKSKSNCCLSSNSKNKVDGY